ncbi:MAG: ATPase [Thermodesulfovibrio sp.]|nr:ATPase [Thermodesulfovibrio sp.]
MKKVIFITSPEAEYGFSLTGLTHCIATEQEAEELLTTKMAEPDPGLIIMDERLLQAVSEQKLRALEAHWRGIILALPSPRQPLADTEDYAVRLIRRAIGYHVRLKP